MKNADIISFHEYEGQQLLRTVSRLRARSNGRPLICTETMARELGSPFQLVLPLLKAEKVGCISWGLVAGRSQTHFSWNTIPSALDRPRWEKPQPRWEVLQHGEEIPEPRMWFHDIFRINGTPFSEQEVYFIRNTTYSHDGEATKTVLVRRVSPSPLSDKRRTPHSFFAAAAEPMEVGVSALGEAEEGGTFPLREEMALVGPLLFLPVSFLIFKVNHIHRA